MKTAVIKTIILLIVLHASTDTSENTVFRFPLVLSANTFAILQRSVTEISEISNFSGLLMLSHSIPVTLLITLSTDSASLSML